MPTAIATDLAPLPDERFDIDVQDDNRGTALVNPRRLPLPQQTTLVDYLERIATALESTVPFHPMAVQPLRPSGKDLVPGLSSEDRKHLRNVESDIAEMKAELVQIKELLSADRGEVVKEVYTVDEAAEKTKYQPFTIRQACNKGRIKEAYKGRDHAWRIPRASLLDIVSNGLPPE